MYEGKGSLGPLRYVVVCDSTPNLPDESHSDNLPYFVKTNRGKILDHQERCFVCDE